MAAMDEEVSTMREPCPWRILDDCGGAFAMGCIGGSVWHGVKGYRSAPMGLKYRECINAIKLRAPTVGGNFGIWGAMFSSFDCSFAALRGKDDPWNAIASGFVTSGVLAARFGASTALKSAVGGGVILACIEGLTVAINNWQTQQMKPQRPQIMDDPLGPAPARS
ncbi:hypothetical protein PTSG_01711 [Salpingoeca rosetta]|uniref:Uncharacterized protein n=1 Tax=Salpingoeca rosetta (strain ATCC 50818 / BSB-021) TaxID=946362 RepID=F2TYQ7_SALR5|nr:uncharacterized protein PTSG_01711 [Salpingoeca rosetta]EGD78731.1 hypothetical protein PTSG_01711 [Salpingoeca rosetta]|eukprot:XP_004997688.1 hypothetical protein PTSG_01711 [Salpingoeca rosetta]